MFFLRLERTPSVDVLMVKYYALQIVNPLQAKSLHAHPEITDASGSFEAVSDRNPDADAEMTFTESIKTRPSMRLLKGE